MAAALPLLYPPAGFFALLAAALCVIWLCVQSRRGDVYRNLAPSAVSVALAAVVPQLYYRYFPGTTADNDFLYLKGLPELTFNDYDWYLWCPFALCTAILLLSAVLSAFAEGGFKSSGFMKWISLAAFCAGLIFCVAADGRKSEQLRTTVLMVDAVQDKDWSKVIHVMSLTKESPNYTMCVLENLARAYCGMERLRLGDMQAATKDYRHDENFTITAFVDVPVNHNIGRFNQSHRWATEHNVQYGKRTYFVKYVVLNALMNGDIQLARKFNRILMRTMFHREWAENMNRYIENPSMTCSLDGYGALMAIRTEEIMRGE